MPSRRRRRTPPRQRWAASTAGSRRRGCRRCRVRTTSSRTRWNSRRFRSRPESTGAPPTTRSTPSPIAWISVATRNGSARSVVRPACVSSTSYQSSRVPSAGERTSAERRSRPSPDRGGPIVSSRRCDAVIGGRLNAVPQSSGERCDADEVSGSRRRPCRGPDPLRRGQVPAPPGRARSAGRCRS